MQNYASHSPPGELRARYALRDGWRAWTLVDGIIQIFKRQTVNTKDDIEQLAKMLAATGWLTDCVKTQAYSLALERALNAARELARPDFKQRITEWLDLPSWHDNGATLNRERNFTVTAVMHAIGEPYTTNTRVIEDELENLGFEPAYVVVDGGPSIRIWKASKT